MDRITVVSGKTARMGLKRCGHCKRQFTAIKRAYKKLYRESLSLEEARAQIAAEARTTPVLAPLAAFLDTAGRGIVR
jgi:UDP-N-acetylglucosamine acyltransferase